MRKIPVLFLIDKMAYGGTERQLMMLVENLDRSRFEPHLCTIRPSSGLLEGWSGPRILLDLESFRSLKALRQVRRLATYVRQQRISLVQAFFPDSFLLGAMLRCMTPVRLVGSFRDMGFWRGRGVSSLKLRLSEPFCAGFIANSEAVREHYIQADRLPRNKVQVIYNGIATGDTVPAAGAPAIPVVGIVGNYTRSVKRMTDFVLAARRVLDRRPETRFMVVGDGALMDGMKAAAGRLKFGEAIHFTGRVSDPMAYIRQFSIGVITSESEGLCNAILEYMACGLPVVATDCGGNGELITEGQNGYLVPVGDIKQLTERLLLLLAEPARRERMGRRSRRTVLDRFSVERMVREHEAYYQTLLSLNAPIPVARAEKG